MEKEELGRGDRNQKAGEGKISFKHGLGWFLTLQWLLAITKSFIRVTFFIQLIFGLSDHPKWVNTRTTSIADLILESI